MSAVPWARTVLASVLVLLALLVEVTVVTRLPLPGATPDLVLLAVLGLALRWGPRAGCVVGFGAGLALDVAPPADQAAGRWALVLCLAGYLAGLARDAAERSALVPLLVAAAASAGTLLLHAAIGAVLGDARTSWPLVTGLLPTAVLYTVLLCPFLVSAVLALARRAEPEGARR